MKKNKHNIETGSSVERSDERIKETQEVFTPPELVELMIDEIAVSLLKDSSSKFIDNSAGCGNFLVGLKERLRLFHNEKHVLNHMLYAVELLEDNHKELCGRLGVTTHHPHYVCADALEYDYSFGEAIGVEQFF